MIKIIKTKNISCNMYTKREKRLMDDLTSVKLNTIKKRLDELLKKSK